MITFVSVDTLIECKIADTINVYEELEYVLNLFD